MNDSAGGGGFWNGDIGNIADSVNNFAAAAASGGFAINQAGGEEMLKAVRRLRDWLEVNLQRLGLLEEQAPLGTSHAAQVVKPFNVQVATDADGFLTRLRQLYESLPTVEEGLRKAMESYRETEHDNQQGFRG